MPLNYGGYNQNTGGFMSPQQAGMSQNDFRFFMNQANQMGAMQPQYGPRQPDMQNLRGGPYRPGQAPGLRPITPPVFNGGVGGMRGGAASQGGITMPAQGIRVGYGLNAPSATPPSPIRPPAPLPMFAQSDRQYSGLSGEGQRPLTIDEQNQLAAMNRQHENMKLRDQNSMALTATGENDRPLWKNNFDELIRQADVMENTQLPERPTGITPQQAFMQIPGNYLTGYQNRFNAIEANRPVAPPQVTASSASPEFKNYAQAIAQADPSFSPNAPAYSVEDGKVIERPRITPTVRTDSPLTAEEVAGMNAVGSSVGDWNKRAKWLAEKGEGATVMTPELAQKYADEQQKTRLDSNALAEKMKDEKRQQAIVRGQKRAEIAQQEFRRRNPGLFAPVNPDAVQFYATVNGAPFRQFNPSNGGLSPLNRAQGLIAYQSNLANQYNEAFVAGDTERAAAINQEMQRIQGQIQGQFIIDGSVPNSPPAPGSGKAPVAPPSGANATQQGRPLTFNGQYSPYPESYSPAAVYGFGPSF